MEELGILEERWNRILQDLPPDREVAQLLIQKLNVAIVSKQNELADLDAEVSKLAASTNPDIKAVIVRGNAYDGSKIEINKIKSSLPSHVNRIIFKLRNNSVVMNRL